MKKNINRYKLLTAFILFSITLFFIVRSIAGVIYSSEITNDLVGQFIDVINIANKAIIVYLLMLFSIAILGLLISRKKEKTEYIRGFMYSLVFLCILLIGYLILYFNIA